MNPVKKLYGSLAARIVAAMILVSTGMVLNDLYWQVSMPLALLGIGLILLGLLLIPGWGGGSREMG